MPLAAASSDFPLFFGFDVGRVELPVAVWFLDNPKISRIICSCQSISSNGFPSHVPWCDSRIFDKAYCVVGGILIVVAALRHKAGWFVVFSFRKCRHLLKNGIKIAATIIGATVVYEEQSLTAPSCLYRIF